MSMGVEDRQIGDRTFRVLQLPALKARALFARLVQFLGPAVAGAVSSGNMSALLNMDVGALVGTLSEKFTEEELSYFGKVLGGCTQLVGDNGNTAVLDEKLQDVVFAGNILQMFKWMGFALEVQFSDFLSELKRIQAVALAAKEKSAQKSPAASTGTSGES